MPKGSDDADNIVKKLISCKVLDLSPTENEAPAWTYEDAVNSDVKFQTFAIPLSVYNAVKSRYGMKDIHFPK